MNKRKSMGTATRVGLLTALLMLVGAATGFIGSAHAIPDDGNRGPGDGKSVGASSDCNCGEPGSSDSDNDRDDKNGKTKAELDAERAKAYENIVSRMEKVNLTPEQTDLVSVMLEVSGFPDTPLNRDLMGFNLVQGGTQYEADARAALAAQEAEGTGPAQNGGEKTVEPINGGDGEIVTWVDPKNGAEVVQTTEFTSAPGDYKIETTYESGSVKTIVSIDSTERASVEGASGTLYRDDSDFEEHVAGIEAWEVSEIQKARSYGDDLTPRQQEIVDELGI